MNFFYKLRMAIARFMYGRNGVDQLGIATVWLYLILSILASVVVRRHMVTGSLLHYAELAVLVLFLFRILSKNLYKRREENAKWLSFWQRIKSGQAGARARHADTAHRYFTCKSCKAICRVPVGKGKIIITCPRCGAQIKAKT